MITTGYGYGYGLVDQKGKIKNGTRGALWPKNDGSISFELSLCFLRRVSYNKGVDINKRTVTIHFYS